MTDLKETVEHTDRNVAQVKRTMEDLASQPTNQEILEAFDEHKIKDEAFQEKSEEFQKKQEAVNLAAEESREKIHERLKNIPDDAKTAEIVEAVIRKTLLSKGKMMYTFTLGAGALAAALVAIFAGTKMVLVALGFSYIPK